MNEELLRNVDKLPMYDPRIDLMKEDLVAHEKDPREHVLDHRIASRAALMQGVKQLSTNQLLVENLPHQGGKCWKHL